MWGRFRSYRRTTVLTLGCISFDLLLAVRTIVGFALSIHVYSFYAEGTLLKMGWCRSTRLRQPPNFEFYGNFFRINLIIHTPNFGFPQDKVCLFQSFVIL